MLNLVYHQDDPDKPRMQGNILIFLMFLLQSAIALSGLTGSVILISFYIPRITTLHYRFIVKASDKVELFSVHPKGIATDIDTSVLVPL